MAISSYIVEEQKGGGKGHTVHGNGKGLGHAKHQQDAMADGEYTMVISGISHTNHGPTDTFMGPTPLADGSSLFTEVRRGSISTGPAPANHDDTSALQLVTDDNNGRLRVTDVYSSEQQVTLGHLDALSFDYYVDSASRTDVIPVIRLAIDGDGNLATTADRGELVFEYAYQGLGPTTQDQWQHADLVGGDWVAWQRSNGANHDEIVNMTAFSDWSDASGFTPSGGVHFDENSVVLGWSIALGSGNGSATMYLDNLQVGAVTYEFA